MSGPWRDAKVRLPRLEAVPFVERLYKEFPRGIEWHLCGSWRRGAPEIGDFDVLVVTETGTFAGIREVLPASFLAEHEGPQVIQGKLYNASEEDLLKSDLRLKDKTMNADFYACTPDQRGAALMFLTGPKALNIVQRAWAKKIGYKLSQYGLFTLSDNFFIACETERDLYKRLGLEWIHPLDRQEYADAKPPDDAKVQTWSVPSDSDKTKRYKVTKKGEGSNSFWSCEDEKTGNKCLGFKYNREIPPTCKHIKRVKKEYNAQ